MTPGARPALRWLAALGLAALPAFGGATGALGWRYDGSGIANGATPGWGPPAWTTPLAADGNGSPVVSGGRVYVTLEPDKLGAYDLSSGRAVWTRATPVLDALDPGIAAAIGDLVRGADGMDAELASARQDYSRALRDARAGTPSATPEALAALSARIDSLTASLAAVAPYRTPGTHDEIGYASPTPVTDGSGVWTLYATGVVARFDLAGQRTWARWLGPPEPVKRGYTGADAASPVLVGGTLIVAYRQLIGMNAQTGDVRWKGPAWPHYGTPAPATVGSRRVVLSPDGLVIDASTGRTLAEGLGNIYYAAPHVEGDRVWYCGYNAVYNSNDPNLAIAWRLTETASGVAAEQLWKVEVPTRDRLYASPVVYGGHLFMVTRQKTLVVLDANTGALVHKAPLSERYGEVWASLVVAGDRVYATTTNGTIFEIRSTAPFDVVAEHAVPGNQTTPWFVGGAVVWRANNALVRFGSL